MGQTTPNTPNGMLKFPIYNNQVAPRAISTPSQMPSYAQSTPVGPNNISPFKSSKVFKAAPLNSSQIITPSSIQPIQSVTNYPPLTPLTNNYQPNLLTL